jgi:hypothetical protein
VTGGDDGDWEDGNVPTIKIRRVDFYPDDWITGTIDLSHDERSVYISLCAAIWAKGGPVDEQYVQHICGSGRVNERHFVRGLAGLLAKGKVTRIETEFGQKLTQIRAESELNRAKIRTESSQNNGAKGGRPNGLAKPAGFGSTRARAFNNQQPSSSLRSEEDTPPPATPAPPLEGGALQPRRFRDPTRRNGNGNGQHKQSPVEKFYEGAYRAVQAREERRHAGHSLDEPPDSDDPADARQVQIEDWLQDLGEFPSALVESACRHWRQNETRRPTPAEIRKIVGIELQRRSRALPDLTKDTEIIQRCKALYEICSVRYAKLGVVCFDECKANLDGPYIPRASWVG